MAREMSKEERRKAKLKRRAERRAAKRERQRAEEEGREMLRDAYGDLRSQQRLDRAVAVDAELRRAERDFGRPAVEDMPSVDEFAERLKAGFKREDFGDLHRDGD